ncbi:MAG: DinB family protein [Ferruginibacter sp.]
MKLIRKGERLHFHESIQKALITRSQKASLARITRQADEVFTLAKKASFTHLNKNNMEIKTQSHRMHSIIVLYDMHTNFFAKAIDGISDEDAHNRLNTKANHVAWLAGSLVHERFELANDLGIQQKHAADELFKNHKGIQDDLKYPPLASFKQDWEKISPLLREVFLNLTDERLDKQFEMMPGHSMAFYDLVSFTAYREANCIGQIALWRRLLGYPAINYM